jgi:hypothetical protein
MHSSLEFPLDFPTPYKIWLVSSAGQHCQLTHQQIAIKWQHAAVPGMQLQQFRTARANLLAGYNLVGDACLATVTAAVACCFVMT